MHIAQTWQVISKSSLLDLTGFGLSWKGTKLLGFFGISGKNGT